MFGGINAVDVANWIAQNKEWLFSGLGVAIVSALLSAIVMFLWRRKRVVSPEQQQRSGADAQNIQAGRDVNISLIAVPGSEGKDGLSDGEEQLLASMSSLVSEMRSGLLDPATEFVREFFVLPSRGVTLGGSSKKRFIYYEEDYPNLRGQIDMLAEHGFVIDVTPFGNRAPIYRMTEKLVKQVYQREAEQGTANGDRG